MAKGEMPEIIFVGLIGKGQRKARYKHTVFQVMSKDDDGTPRNVRLLKDDEVVDLQGGEEFITAYVPEVNFKGAR